MELSEIKALFKNVDLNVLKLLEPYMEETVFLKNQLNNLKKFPLIKINPKDPTMQKRTEAGKMLKDYEQAYSNNVKVLLSVLSQSVSDNGNSLKEVLKAFQ